MTKNRIVIQQNLYRTPTNQINNEYHFYSEHGVYLGALLFPADGQYIFDDKILNINTKALAIRWGLIPSKNIK